MRVIIESPYAGDTERNIDYARQCLKDSLSRGEYPIASHLLYTQVLDDTVPEERSKGIRAGLSWLSVAEKHVFYVDLGVTEGMRTAAQFSSHQGFDIEFRRLYKD